VPGIGRTAALGVWRTEIRHYADLVREVFANPSSKRAIDPSWLAWGDGLVPKLAEQIQAEQAWDRLGILGDALEDAGCNDAVLLEHLRGSRPHVRGCWALDLLAAGQ
jgi:hypothetical protein